MASKNPSDYQKYSYTYLTADEIAAMSTGTAKFTRKLKRQTTWADQYLTDAVDINWQGVKIDGQDVLSSGHLGYLVSQHNGEAGLPVLNDEKITSLRDAGKLPDEYIYVPTSDEITEPSGSVSETALSGQYLDIIFSQIRALQAKVAELEQYRTYGVHSLNDDVTTMSAVMETHDTEPSEPLWATNEDTLSEIPNNFVFNSEYDGLQPIENVTLGDDSYKIDGTATWSDYEDNMKLSVDPKQYAFITSSSPNISFTLQNIENEADTRIIDISKLNILQTSSERYNILLILNRSTKKPVNSSYEYYNDNFAWVQVADYLTCVSCAEGYWRDNKLYDAKQVLGTPQSARYYISKVSFSDLTLYKFNTYSKYQDFTNEVDAVPFDHEDLGTVAHITIRSVESDAVLDKIKAQLTSNELIYIEKTNTLKIKNRAGDIKTLLGGKDSSDEDNTGMTQEEIISWLEENGIVVYETGHGTGEATVNLAPISDITFINQATGKKFKFDVDSAGNLRSTRLEDMTLAARVDAFKDTDMFADDAYHNRGFIGTLLMAEAGKDTDNTSGDAKLNSDRLKIGAIYAPKRGQQTYGCTHAYVELENTSDKDIHLDGCYLRFATQKLVDNHVSEGNVTEYSVALDGVIRAGSTYLIRGRKYADAAQSNVFIDVKTFDKEWFVTDNEGNVELADLSIDDQTTLMLTWGNTIAGSPITWKTALCKKDTEAGTSQMLYSIHFIDSISIGNPITLENGSRTWDILSKAYFIVRDKDAIYKTMFELDPAKQAFNALLTLTSGDVGKDSSRLRGGNVSDLQTLTIDEPYISFPKSDERKLVSDYTPRASFENKNVITDKTQFDVEKPDMVTVSFGMDMARTRCFNWVSGGYYDEFLFIRKKGDTTWSRFESYNSKHSYDNNSAHPYISKKDYGTFTNALGQQQTVQSVVYDRMTNVWPGSGIQYTAHKCVLDFDFSEPLTQPEVYEYCVGRADISYNIDNEHCSDVKTFTMYPSSYKIRIYQTTDQQGFHWVEYQYWAAVAKVLNDKIYADTHNSDGSYNGIVPVLINTGDMTQNGTRVNEWLDYYHAGDCLFNHLEQMNVVGNNDLCNPDFTALGTGDDSGKSNAYYFHLFYCYDIDTDPGRLPIISNTEATQYVPSMYYFGQLSSTSPYAVVMFNTEITVVTCDKWYKQHMMLNNEQHTVNVYTGWTVKTTNVLDNDDNMLYDTSFTTIYTMLYNTFAYLINDLHVNASNIVVGCHEMPFTVLTSENITAKKGDASTGLQAVDRSLSGSSTGSLVGCHCNRLNYSDVKSNYWLSRLLEYFNIVIMIGGHKHTYMCSNPLCENYMYTVQDNEGNTVTKSSLIDGPMEMHQTLQDDNVSFIMNVIMIPETQQTVTVDGQETTVTIGQHCIYDDGTHEGDDVVRAQIHTSKFPLMQTVYDKNRTVSGAGVEFSNNGNVCYPYYGIAAHHVNAHPVVYFMCQATGYKLMSNKELPSGDQRFSMFIPAQNNGKAGPEQKYAMFAIIDPVEGAIKLARIKGITAKNDNTSKTNNADGQHLLEQNCYSTNPISIQWFIGNTGVDESKRSIYGNWPSGTTSNNETSFYKYKQ